MLWRFACGSNRAATPERHAPRFFIKRRLRQFELEGQRGGVCWEAFELPTIYHTFDCGGVSVGAGIGLQPMHISRGYERSWKPCTIYWSWGHKRRIFVEVMI